jgi:alpha-N-arabinofuranosidase
MSVLKNPVLPGFHPDPSICRVGADYYLATSSFEYFPGVPLFHSRDLVSWRQLGHALTRRTQLELGKTKSSKGIFAPTLRYHQGTFYLVTTHVEGGGNFFVTAADPAGPWSEPIWIREQAWGMDPSLLFDDDGKVYFTRHGGGERGGVYQAEIDIKTGELAAEPRLIYSGTGGVWPEGPHLYKHGGYYYLLLAEGGTSYNHMVTLARSKSPYGPFVGAPQNPILTHKNQRELPIQALGHADLFQAENQSFWLVLLGVRPADMSEGDRGHHHLGRETFLAPVSWDAQGWLVVNENAPIQPKMTVSGLPEPQPWPLEPRRDHFDQTELGHRYVFVRNPEPGSWSLSARPGFLRLTGNKATLSEAESPAFVGRRQQHFNCTLSTLVDFEPTHPDQEAGLVLRQNDDNHYDLLVKGSKAGRRVVLRTQIKGEERILAEAPLRQGPVVLRVRASNNGYQFWYETPERPAPAGDPPPLGTAATLPLSSESAGGFTGVVAGLYASAGQAKQAPPADFDWFDYRVE